MRGFLRFAGGARGLAGARSTRAVERALERFELAAVATRPGRQPLEGLPAARLARAGLPARSAAADRGRADRRPRPACSRPRCRRCCAACAASARCCSAPTTSTRRARSRRASAVLHAGRLVAPRADGGGARRRRPAGALPRRRGRGVTPLRALVRKELASLFGSPTAYLALTMVALVTALIFFDHLRALQPDPLRLRLERRWAASTSDTDPRLREPVGQRLLPGDGDARRSR